MVSMVVRPLSLSASVSASRNRIQLFCQTQNSLPLISSQLQYESQRRIRGYSFVPHTQSARLPSERLRLRVPVPIGVGTHDKFELRLHSRFSVRAAHVNDAGSIDSPLMQSMENKLVTLMFDITYHVRNDLENSLKQISEQLNAESVTVKDAYGDGRHVSINVVASCFEGQSAVNRQRMVYKAIWEELQSTVHAVDQMTTRTPAEVATATENK